MLREAWLLLLALFVANAAQAAIPPVFWPDDDAQLVEVPLSVASPAKDDRSQQWVNEGETLEAAERAIRAFREQGNPRRLGEADRLLNGAVTAADVAPDQRWRYVFLQSQLAQSLHQFDRAWRHLADAERLIKRLDDTDLRSAATVQWLLAAYHLALVQGDYAAAQAHCEAMSDVAANLYSDSCRLYLRGLREKDGQAFQSLHVLIAKHLLSGDAALHWVAVSRADLADRFFDDKALEAWRMALVLSPEDRYTRSRYCEAALRAEDYQRALSLTAAKSDDEAMLFCRLMALHRITSKATAESVSRADHAEYLQLRARVEERFAEMARRGGIPVSRHRARYLLEVEGKPLEALKMAEELWVEQREWPDQQLLETARAAVEGTP